jgi:anti-anti-sigma factor
MLRISQTSTTEGHTTLRLEGNVGGRWVEELRRECARVLGGEAHDGRPFVLDLAGVSSIDSSGLALIRELSTRRVVLKDCSPM